MNPTEPKVYAASVGAGVAGAVVALILNLINGEPLDQTAITTIVSAVVPAVIALVAGWLRTTPVAVLAQRLEANRTLQTPPTHK